MSELEEAFKELRDANAKYSIEVLQLKQQLDEAIFFIEQKVECDIRTIPTAIGEARVHKDDCWKCEFLAKYRGEK